MLVVVTSDPQSAFWNVKNILRLVNVTMLQTSDHEIPIKVRGAQDCRSRITNWNYFQHLRDLLEKENELNLLVIACCTNCRAIWLHCRVKVYFFRTLFQKMESIGLNSAMYFLNGFYMLHCRLSCVFQLFTVLLYIQSDFLDCDRAD